MFEKSNNYERYDYDMIEVLGNTGGISDALLVIAGLIVFFFMDINSNVTSIKIFSSILKNVPE
jgi:hypothetical protein